MVSEVSIDVKDGAVIGCASGEGMVRALSGAEPEPDAFLADVLSYNLQL